MLSARIATIIALILITTGCANVNTHSTKNGVCNQLRSTLIFNGNTSNTRQAEIQNAETPLVARTYDQHCE